MRIYVALIALLAVACARGPAAIESNAHDVAVIGGEPVQQNEKIAQHVVMLRSKGRSARQFCTATLLRRDLVLTAAHCVVLLNASLQQLETNDDFEMVFSTEALTQDSSRIRRPNKIAIHPKFLRMTTLCQLNSNAIGCDQFLRIPWKKLPPKEDLALISLDSPAPVDAQPIQLARSMPASPVPLVMIGGGLRENLNSSGTTLEQARKYSGRLDQFKKSVYFTWNPLRTEPRSGWRTSNGEVCVEETADRSTAPGDSGGPLMIETENGFELLGVYSTMTKNAFYDGRARERLACYMDLLKSNEWIESNSLSTSL